jgi:CYTH domain-containing protein
MGFVSQVACDTFESPDWLGIEVTGDERYACDPRPPRGR